MPVRATKRGDERTPLDGPRDILICGASFAGLMVARELEGSGADVLVVDRYEIGERQTSACGIPTDWLTALGLEAAERQRFDSVVVHSPHGSARMPLPWSLSTFDYRQLCELLWEECDADFETAKVNGRAPNPDRDDQIHVGTDRGTISAPLVVDALGWRRVLAMGDGFQPPEAPLSRGLEVHPSGPGEDMEIWIDRRYVPAGYGWVFPAGDECRIGIGSFDPGFHVRRTTELLAGETGRDRVGFQGNWIPHKLRPATEGGVFFAGDSAGHCLPLTAEGIRTALYFGMTLGAQLRAVIDGSSTRDDAMAAYAEFNDAHERKFRWLLNSQRILPRIPPRVLGPLLRLIRPRKRFVFWAFDRYMQIAPPGSVSRRRRVRSGLDAHVAEHAAHS